MYQTSWTTPALNDGVFFRFCDKNLMKWSDTSGWNHIVSTENVEIAKEFSDTCNYPKPKYKFQNRREYALWTVTTRVPRITSIIWQIWSRSIADTSSGRNGRYVLLPPLITRLNPQFRTSLTAFLFRISVLVSYSRNTESPNILNASADGSEMEWFDKYWSYFFRQ